MDRFTILGLAALLAAGAATPASAQCDQLPGCELVWADEFDGTEVDLSKWTFQLGDGTAIGLPGWGNNELQWYRAENAAVADGMLTITAREESFAGKDYTSTRMRSLGKGDWTFGRMEMRARMPIGQGLWPAFWMLPSASPHGTWAASGEIDIVEYVGHEPDRIFGTIHYGAPFPGNVFASTAYTLGSGTFHDDFHVFAVEWDFGEIRWYIDGVRYARRLSWWSTGGPFPAPFDVDFHLLLNLAVGGNLPGDPDETTQFPQEYVIDYVRVYQQPPAIAIASPAASDSITPGDDLTITIAADDESQIALVQFYQGNALLGEDTVPPFELTVPNAPAGCYTLSARGQETNGRPHEATPVAITVGPGCTQSPYRIAPAAIPGTIEAEDYDLGGQGVAYNDSDSGNNGGSYRPDEAVDIESSSDAGGGFNVGWTTAGEWIEYAVDVRAGTYDVELRVASAKGGGTVHLEFDGIDRTGPISFGNTGGWQNWTTVRAEGVTLDPGVQTMRLVMDAGSFNLNKVTIPQPPGVVGAVPDGRAVPGVPLTLDVDAARDLVLSWGSSCLETDPDYVVYEGTLGSFDTHMPVTCSTGGATSWGLTATDGDRYFLIAPTDGVWEGYRGATSGGDDRALGAATCYPPNVAECP